MSTTRPEIIFEAVGYPGEKDLIKQLVNKNLIDSVLVPDTPLSKVNIDSVVASKMIIDEVGVRPYTVLSLNGRDRVATAARIASCLLIGVKGVVFVRGERGLCKPSMSVVEAISLCRSIIDSGSDAFKEFGFNLISRLRTIRWGAEKKTRVGGSVDLANHDSLRFAKKKIKAGADILFTQLLTPGTPLVRESFSLLRNVDLALGVPYVESERSSLVVERLTGSRFKPGDGRVVDYLKEVFVECLRKYDKPPSVYVSVIGRFSEDKLLRFLLSIRELVEKWAG